MKAFFNVMAMTACIVLLVGLIAGLIAVNAWVMLWAWTTVAVPAFHAPRLTFWQMFAISATLWALSGFFWKGSSSK